MAISWTVICSERLEGGFLEAHWHFLMFDNMVTILFSLSGIILRTDMKINKVIICRLHYITHHILSACNSNSEGSTHGKSVFSESCQSWNILAWPRDAACLVTGTWKNLTSRFPSVPSICPISRMVSWHLQVFVQVQWSCLAGSLNALHLFGTVLNSYSFCREGFDLICSTTWKISKVFISRNAVSVFHTYIQMGHVYLFVFKAWQFIMNYYFFLICQQNCSITKCRNSQLKEC